MPKTTVKILCQKIATRMGQRVKKEVTYSVKNTLPITSNPALMSISHRLSVRDVACLAFQKGLCHHRQRLINILSTSLSSKKFRYLNSIDLTEPYGVVFIGRGRDLLVGCGPGWENEEDAYLLGCVLCGHQGQGFPGEANLQKPVNDGHLGSDAG